MSNEIYHHVEQATLKVVEALMKGFVITLGGDRIRYLRKGQIVGDREATESGFFVPMTSDNGEIWIKLTGEFGFIESKIKSATHDEIDFIIANLAFDSDKRKDSAFRILSVAKTRLKKDGGRAFLLKAFKGEEYQRTESVIMNVLYDYLQKDNTFPMDRTQFYSLENVHLDEIMSMLFDTLNALILENLIDSKSVPYDACPYAKAV